MTTPAFTAAWLAQRVQAAANLAAVSDRELAELTPEEALRRSDALLELGARAPVAANRVTHSGFVEQALFARIRK